MSKKRIIIIITALVLIGIIVFGLYRWLNGKNSGGSNTNTNYQNFNPFGTGSNNNNSNVNGTNSNGANNQTTGTQVTVIPKFTQITDFAVAGATFLKDIRPIDKSKVGSVPQTVEIKTVINANTTEGRKEIQAILNKTLSLKTPLTIDGKFGKAVAAAIKSFQKLNNLPATGVVDSATSPLFTKTTTSTTENATTELAPAIRYVKRMDGHIYKMFLDTKAKEEISISTIPAIYEAYFNNTANSVIYRYLSADKSISTFLATLGAPQGEFLPQDIPDLSVSFDKTKYFYLARNSDGVTGVVGTFGSSKKDIVFSYPFTEWLSDWDNGGNIYLTTKPSYSAGGSVFLLDQTQKTISKLFGGVLGLTTMINPNGLSILYGTSDNLGYELGIFDIMNHSTKSLAVGFPEKCVWSNDDVNIYCGLPNTITGNQYPDDWYKGLVSFDDYFVKINTKTGEKTTIANSLSETPVDATQLFLNDTEDTLFFINKKDSTLWSLNLK